MVVYYFGFESLAEYGIEAVATYGTAVTPTDGFSHLRSASFIVNENVERNFNIGGGTLRKPDSADKGTHVVTGNLNFWLPDDLDATTLDAWFLKLGLDGFNVAHDGSKWLIPNTGTSVYGGLTLPSWTLEIGHNKSGAIRMNRLSGCVVESMTVSAAKGEKVNFTIDFVGKDASCNNTSFGNGSATRSTSPPLGWHNCIVGYADDGASPAAKTDITALEFTFANSLVPNYDLSAVTPKRALTTIIPGRQDITGSMTINLTTTAGMDLYDAVMNDASAPYIPDEDVKEKAISLAINNTANTATQNITFVLRKVVLGEVPMDINPEVVQEVTVPFTAQYYLCTLTTTDATAPTNWSDES